MLALAKVAVKARFVKVLLLVLSLGLLVFASQAASVSYTGTINSSPTMAVDPFCGSGLTNIPYADEGVITVSSTGSYTYYDDSFFAGAYDSVMLLYTAPLDPANPNSNLAVKIDDSGTVNLTAGVSYYMIIIPFCGHGPGNYGFTFTGAGTISIGSRPTPAPAAVVTEESDVVYPPDNRINWQFGDLSAVLYSTNGGVAAYCYNAEGNTSWLGFFADQTTVDNWDASQGQDLAVLEVNENGCHAAFYILDSGEYQVNIWTQDGKFYEVIADNLAFENATLRGAATN